MLGLEQGGGSGGQLLQHQQQQHQRMEPQLGELLLDVQAGLGKMVRSQGQQQQEGGDGSQAGAAAGSGLHGIQSLLDELKFWADLASDSPGGEACARARGAAAGCAQAQVLGAVALSAAPSTVPHEHFSLSRVANVATTQGARPPRRRRRC